MAGRQYQSFRAGVGDSASADKLAALCLPDLNGKSFLDLGCNEGFFCGYAAARGASRVLGVDYDPEFIARARARFPGVSFENKGWDQLADAKFDVILFASALHYAVDQEALLHKLMTFLAKDGLLVLEVGMAPGMQAEWVSHERHDGFRSYATRSIFETMLDPYAYKLVGPSVNQAGDAIGRWVWHVRHKRPVLMILASSSYSGKSTLSRSLSQVGVAVCEIDLAVLQYFTDPPSGELGSSIRKLREHYNPALHGDKIIGAVFEERLGTEFITQAVSALDSDVTIVDGYIPAHYIPELVTGLERAGYVVWSASPARQFGEEVASSPMIEDIGGEIMFISESDELGGRIDVITTSNGSIVISGWAANAASKSRVERYAVLVDGNVVEYDLVRTRRPDLEALEYVHAGEEAGFTLRVSGPPSGYQNITIYLIGEERRIHKLPSWEPLVDRVRD